MVLDKESREFVTINTHMGLYRYTRLPFGVASALAIFQHTMDTILRGLTHVQCFINDILITLQLENMSWHTWHSHRKNVPAYCLMCTVTNNKYGSELISKHGSTYTGNALN